jgi:hypothetical protein
MLGNLAPEDVGAFSAAKANKTAIAGNHKGGGGQQVVLPVHPSVLEKERVTMTNPHGVNMGMPSACGLEPPVPALPTDTDPLWLERPLDGNGAVASAAMRKLRKSAIDENKLIKKKFKAKPTTQAEVRDCAQALTPEELLCIVAGPKLMDFGKVCVNSVSQKSFSVSNDLGQQSIFVRLLCNEEELSQTSPLSQVIPAGSVAGFDVTFSGRIEKSFRHTVNYIINEQHTFKFTVNADVVPVTLTLSAKELSFAFPESSLDFVAKEKLTLTNPGNAVCGFKWAINTAGVFSVEPPLGSLEPNASMDLNVSWEPQLNGRNEGNLTLRVDGGADQILKCVGALSEVVSKCSFTEKKGLDFGNLAVGIEKDKRLVLKNNGSASAVFQIEPFKATSGITVRPMKGRVGPGDTLEFTVCIKPPKPSDIDGFAVVARIRAGKTLKVPLLGRAIFPDVRISQEEFSFGGVTIGAVEKLRLSLENKGDITAMGVLDLSKYKDEFSVFLSADLSQKNADAGNSIIPLGFEEQEPALPGGSGGGGDPVQGEPPSQQQAKSSVVTTRWELTIAPHSLLEFNFKYAPSVIRDHAFELPLRLVGVNTSQPSLQRVVSGSGLKPRLLVSSTAVDFGERVVSRDRIKKAPYSKEITLTNDDGESLSWELDMDNVDTAMGNRSSSLPGGGGSEPIFHVAPKSGELAPGESRTIRVTYLPCEARVTDVSVPVYLDGDKSKPYLSVQCTGSGIYPHLSFDKDDVILPVVPLGVQSVATFYVLNTGYDNLELKHRSHPKPETRTLNPNPKPETLQPKPEPETRNPTT